MCELGQDLPPVAIDCRIKEGKTDAAVNKREGTMNNKTSPLVHLTRQGLVIALHPEAVPTMSEVGGSSLGSLLGRSGVYEE